MRNMQFWCLNSNYKLQTFIKYERTSQVHNVFLHVFGQCWYLFIWMASANGSELQTHWAPGSQIVKYNSCSIGFRGNSQFNWILCYCTWIQFLQSATCIVLNQHSVRVRGCTVLFIFGKESKQLFTWKYKRKHALFVMICLFIANKYEKWTVNNCMVLDTQYTAYCVHFAIRSAEYCSP